MLADIREFLRDKSRVHHAVYLLFILGIVACMPLSKWITSMFQFLLIIHWLIRGNYQEKWERLKSRPAIWILSLFFLLPLLGMIHTYNLDYGFHDLKIKIPLLAMPLVIGTSEILSKKELKLGLLIFAGSVTVSSLVSLGIISRIIPYTYTDIRETSLFISHIRLALLVDMAIFILSFYALRSSITARERAGLFAWAFYLLIFLLAAKALTGLVVGLFVGIVLASRWLLNQKNNIIKWLCLAAVVIVPALSAGYIIWKVNDFYTIRESKTELEKLTARGNPYWHDLENQHLENGYYTGIYICEPEMRKAWDNISELKYDGQDQRGQEIRYTLIRYLTSRGLRKDALGVSQLETDDIDLIENGFANHIYKNKNRFSVRIYELIWEIDVYRKGGNPSGHSVTQRIEYIKTGLKILIDKPVFGVGTGDVPEAFENKYIETESQLDPEWRLRAHNQWLTFVIGLGIPAAFLLLLAFISPGILQKKYNQYFYLLFLMVSFLSMFNEDTLETQAGVAFFAFFYTFLLFAPDHENK